MTRPDPQPLGNEDRHSEEDLALLISEDKRLIRLGIDPDGDPLEIMRRLEQKVAELSEARSDEPGGDAWPPLESEALR